MILVIDDQQEERHQIVLAARMMPTKPAVVTAADAQEALTLLRHHGQDILLVVLDMRMGIKGILLIPHIRNLAPDARILPYTVDEGAAEQMEALGALPRVQKLLPAREIAAILSHSLTTPRPPVIHDPFYRYVADDAEGISTKIGEKQLRIAILGASDLEAQGLRAIIQRVGDYVPLAIVLTTHIRDTVSTVLNTPMNALVIGTVAVLEDIITLYTRGLPCAIYALHSDDVSRVPSGVRVVFEGSASRIADTLVGHEHDVLRQLSPRQRRVIRYLKDGLQHNAIASQLNISSDRLYHVLGEIYKTPGLPSSLAELRVWVTQI